MEKKFSELEEGVDYIDMDKRSFAERLPEIVEKEANKESADSYGVNNLDIDEEFAAQQKISEIVLEENPGLLEETVDDLFDKGPRWIVFAQIEEFWSYHLGRWDKTLTKADPVDVKVNGNREQRFRDEWVVCESLTTALEAYDTFCKLENMRIAGISAVVKSTDYDYVSSAEFSQAKLFLAGTPE